MKSLVFLLLVSTVSGGYRYRKERARDGGVFKFLVSGNETAIKQALSTCLTPGCVKAAATVLEMIDMKVDPCDNFYDFACGNFLKETTIPDHKSETGSFQMLADKHNERLRKLFETSPSANEPKIFESVRNYYKSCLDQDNIEVTGRKALLDMVGQLGGWPILEGNNWEDKTFTWQDFDVKANQKGLDTGRIIKFEILANSENVNMRMMHVVQPNLGLSREYMINGVNNKEVKAYFRYMVDLAVYLGATKEIAEEELKESLLFEIKLAEISLPRELLRNATALTNPMIVKEANKLFPGFNWTEHINNIFPDLEAPLQSNEVINLKVPLYVKRIAEYLPTVPARVQANYLIWRTIKDLVLFGDKTVQQIDLKYINILTGESLVSPRWEICAKVVAGLNGNLEFYFKEGSLTNAVGAMFAKEYFPESSKLVADEMVINIKREFKIILDELEWMDDITKKKAHVKVDKMTPHIGYAKEILDNNLVNEFYQGLELNSLDFLRNYLNLTSFIKKYNSKEFRKPINHKSWKIHGGAAIVEAFYGVHQNSLIFPAGILYGVFFQSDRPKYMNYGAIGSVIGHEITHGFDDQGSQRDEDGNLVNWWEPETKQKFLEKAQCIIDQYGNYTVDINGTVYNLDSINTQGENIADNGGIKEAYRAYKRLIRKEGEELSLPGLQYTPRQLFWISSAALYCKVARDNQMINTILTDYHAPYRFRVLGPFSNQKEFSKDWNCPLGSAMNPEKKCSVW
ncbi:neprilysin-2 isoform X2 [Eurytemora carolleeae]|uniref:neprilysin-2 isoform X2 n=1 Tax=Eurytemora carolleeae TaxID=1294199 RepID=UPI000C75FA37|nr:neprilysin-2 isoform X2 [Eurytemora carolleeae]|eukprot:XP_023343178.1 neprilysin-2-like isoform X2 [Eurytemora affinis]